LVKGLQENVGVEPVLPSIEISAEYSRLESVQDAVLIPLDPAPAVPVALEWPEVLRCVGPGVVAIRAEEAQIGAAWWVAGHRYWAPEVLAPLLEKAKTLHLEWPGHDGKSWQVIRRRRPERSRGIELSLHASAPWPKVSPLPPPSSAGLLAGTEVGMVVWKKKETQLVPVVLEEGKSMEYNSVVWRVRVLDETESFAWLPGIPVFARDLTLMGFALHFKPPFLTLQLPPF
jgi:hypothetical protein